MAEWAIAPTWTLVDENGTNHIGAVTARFGSKAWVVGGLTALERTESALRASLQRAGVQCRGVVHFHGECCPSAVRKLMDQLDPADVAIAVGGGKVIDTMKAAARGVGTSVITVPTCPATCAATTALVVMHNEEGGYRIGEVHPPAPEATVLDLSVLRTAPRRLVAAGLADAWARSLETALASEVSLPTGASVFSLGVANAYAERVLLVEGKSVLDGDMETPAFERTMVACILGAGLASGLCGGFFRLNVAHSVAYGLTHLVDPDAVLHGEMVGLELLVQASLQDSSETSFRRTQAVLESWGLPTRFDGFPAISATPKFLDRLADYASDTLDRERAVPLDVSRADLRGALDRISGR